MEEIATLKDCDTHYELTFYYLTHIKPILPIKRLVQKHFRKNGKAPKVILIPLKKIQRYSIKGICSFDVLDSVCGIPIRYYDGTKTEVY